MSEETSPVAPTAPRPPPPPPPPPRIASGVPGVPAKPSRSSLNPNNQSTSPVPQSSSSTPPPPSPPPFPTPPPPQNEARDTSPARTTVLSSQLSPPPPPPPPPARPTTSPLPPTRSPTTSSSAAATSISTTSSSASAAALSGDEVVLLEGMLSKRNREGAFEKSLVVLTPTVFKYSHVPATSKFGEMFSSTGSETYKDIALESVVVRPLQEGDYNDSEKQGRAFRFFSKHKSFLLRAKTEEMKDEWFLAIEKAARECRRQKGISTEPTEEDMSPLWQLVGKDSKQCSICNTNFTFFIRKHHCRNCGLCICEPCSKDKVRIPKLHPSNLYKVCNPCGAALKDARQYGAGEK